MYTVCGARVAGLEANNGKIWRENTAAFICADCYAKQPDPYKTFRMPEIEARSGRSILPVPNYRVQRLIGRGGMGAVYLADPHTAAVINSKVTCKSLPKQCVRL